MLLRTFLPTPLGPMLAVASDAGLCGLEFDVPERATRLWSRLRRWRAGTEAVDGHAPVFDVTREWLDAYFSSAAGRRSGRLRWTCTAPSSSGRSGGRSRRFRPGGRRRTATSRRRLERRDASRAVGAAVGANPVSLIVPCHRVIGLDGGLTGYGGGLPRKEWLLRHEGVPACCERRRHRTGPARPIGRSRRSISSSSSPAPTSSPRRSRPARAWCRPSACASALALVAIGSVAGSLLIALLSAVGPRYGVPSVIAARAALGIRGAGLVALLLYTTNFAWIAVNNVIAASACAQIAGGPGSLRAWAVGLGVLSTLIVAGGPRLVARADRLAVPLLALVGAALTVACLRVPSATVWAPGDGSLAWLGGLDIVVGYQVSWVLMFADYSRYTPSGKRAGIAVFLGLALTSLWLMPLGAIASRAAASSDPGAMLQALKLGVSGAVLMTVATVTTNFVNIYMSSLALRSLVPRAGGQLTVWSTGLVAAGLSLFSGAWLDRYASFMMVLGGILVPVGGILLARFYLRPRRGQDRVALRPRWRVRPPPGIRRRRTGRVGVRRRRVLPGGKPGPDAPRAGGGGGGVSAPEADGKRQPVISCQFPVGSRSRVTDWPLTTDS